jgi:hypothetical protein
MIAHKLAKQAEQRAALKLASREAAIANLMESVHVSRAGASLAVDNTPLALVTVGKGLSARGIARTTAAAWKNRTANAARWILNNLDRMAGVDKRFEAEFDKQAWWNGADVPGWVAMEAEERRAGAAEQRAAIRSWLPNAKVAELKVALRAHGRRLPGGLGKKKVDLQAQLGEALDREAEALDREAEEDRVADFTAHDAVERWGAASYHPAADAAAWAAAAAADPRSDPRSENLWRELIHEFSIPPMVRGERPSERKEAALAAARASARASVSDGKSKELVDDGEEEPAAAQALTPFESELAAWDAETDNMLSEKVGGTKRHKRRHNLSHRRKRKSLRNRTRHKKQKVKKKRRRTCMQRRCSTKKCKKKKKRKGK